MDSTSKQVESMSGAPPKQQASGDVDVANKPSITKSKSDTSARAINIEEDIIATAPTESDLENGNISSSESKTNGVNNKPADSKWIRFRTRAMNSPAGGLLRKLQSLKNMANLHSPSSENTRLLTSNSDSRLSQNGGTFGTPPGSNSGFLGPGGPGGGGYEELFKDSVPCPSCRGLGRVPKELENQLVALIPMKDGRLKPRRTLLYVAIAVGLCILTAGLLIFFLMPRDITISSNRPFLQPKHIDINATAKFANFTVTNHYNVSNNNFYPVKITGVFMKSLYGNAVIAQSWAYKTDPLDISARSEDELSVPMDFVLSGEHGSLVSHCLSNWTWIHNLPILFEVTANYTYMGHSEQATLTTFQTVSCHPESPPPPSTIKPPDTTAATVTTTTTTTTTTTKNNADTDKSAR